MMKRFLVLLGLLLFLVMGCELPNTQTQDGVAGDTLSYSISGLPNSVESVLLNYSNEVVSADILEEEMTPILSRPVDVNISQYSQEVVTPESILIDLIVPEKPDALVVLNKTCTDVELRPFLYDENNSKMQFRVKSNEEVSIVPVTCNGMENIEQIGEEDPDGLVFGKTVFSSKKPFNILVNDGNQIQVKLDNGFFKRHNDWLNFSYLYVVRNQSDKIVASGSSSGLITINVPESGVYSFQINVKYRKKYRFLWMEWYGAFFDKWILWRQDVAVEKYSISIAKIDELANLYSPILVKDKDEYYQPSSLEYIFNNESIDPLLNNEDFELKDTRTFRPTLYESLMPLTEFKFGQVDQVLPYFGNKNTYINILDHAEMANSRMRFRTNPETPIVYYTFQERGDYEFINYHFLYPFDLKSGSPASPGLGSHIFDRESLVVVLDKPTHTPLYTVYGGHLSDNSFSYVSEFIIPAPQVSWKPGRIRRTWASTATVPYKNKPEIQMDNDTIRAGTHPLVFIGRGSHAVYPYPGLYAYGFWEYAGSPPFAGWNLEQIIMPPAIPAAALQNYELRNAGGITSNGDSKYLAYSGFLVDVLGRTNAKFPPFTSREMNPVDYCINAPAVDWNWISDKRRADLISLEDIIDDYIPVTDPFSPY